MTRAAHACHTNQRPQIGHSRHLRHVQDLRAPTQRPQAAMACSPLLAQHPLAPAPSGAPTPSPVPAQLAALPPHSPPLGPGLRSPSPVPPCCSSHPRGRPKTRMRRVEFVTKCFVKTETPGSQYAHPLASPGTNGATTLDSRAAAALGHATRGMPGAARPAPQGRRTRAPAATGAAWRARGRRGRAGTCWGVHSELFAARGARNRPAGHAICACASDRWIWKVWGWRAQADWQASDLCVRQLVLCCTIVQEFPVCVVLVPYCSGLSARGISKIDSHLGGRLVGEIQMQPDGLMLCGYCVEFLRA